MLNKQLIIIFSVGLIISLLLLMPASVFINNSKLPDGVNINIHRGNIWQGTANVYVSPATAEVKRESQVFLLDWQLCLGSSFPFISYCLNIKNAGNDHKVKLVGLPGSKLVMEDIKSSIAVSAITQQLQINNLSLLRLRGSLNIGLANFIYDREENIPLQWDGRMTLESGGFFNLDFPQLVFIMSQQSFISRGDSSQAFANDKLPTVIIQGNDDTMSIDGTLQILPDKQIKLSLEILARNDLVEKTFAPLATNREGRKLFITYQGPLS